MNWIKKNKVFVLFICLGFITWVINQFPLFIENFYSTGIYPSISKFMRLLFGWLPFSFGDILYGFFIVFFLVKTFTFLKHIYSVGWAKINWRKGIKKIAYYALILYVIFNWMWGFNYNRLGSAYQFNLKLEKYSKTDLQQLADTLQAKLVLLCSDTVKLQNEEFNSYPNLKNQCLEAYKTASKEYPFLQYNQLSVKPALLGSWGNYMGFLGYINPVTLEAQLNQSIPHYLVPYVCCHEMAHQLGYASESEANLIGYMACKQSTNNYLKFSVYSDLMNYSIRDMISWDTKLAIKYLINSPMFLKTNQKKSRIFFNHYQNKAGPMIDWMYDKYLKLNKQPKGRESYNEIIGWLIAYAKKYGWDKI